MLVSSRAAVLAGALAVLTLGAGAPEVHAAPCTGPSAFSDVAQADIFCTDAEWLKNRGITMGCDVGQYCPNQTVTRAQMALFMQRLGTALSPVARRAEGSSGSIDLDASGDIIVCATASYTPTFPSMAIIKSTFAGLAAAPLGYQHDIFEDRGSGFGYLTEYINRNAATGAHWVSSSLGWTSNLTPGTTYRWAVRLARDDGFGTGDFAQGRCFMDVQIYSRTSATSPYDEPVEIRSDRVRPDR